MPQISSSMNAGRLTSLSRVIDPRYSSNRLAVVGSVVAGCIGLVASLLDADLVFGPIGAAVAVFLSWAIARELDPDHPIAAALAMPTAFVLLLAVGEASLLVGTAVLLAVRITAGTVGTDLRLLDLLAVVGLSGLLATHPVGIVGLTLLLAAVWISEPTARSAGVTGAAVAAFVGVAVLSGTEMGWETPGAAGWVTLALTMLAIALVLPAAPLSSQTDRRTGTVDRRRVTAARLLAGLGVVGAFLVAGGIGIQAIAPMTTAALVGTAVRRAASRAG